MTEWYGFLGLLTVCVLLAGLVRVAHQTTREMRGPSLVRRWRTSPAKPAAADALAPRLTVIRFPAGAGETPASASAGFIPPPR
jgi:hypothetical protein